MAALQSLCAWFRVGLLAALLLGGHLAQAQPARPDSLLAALRTEPTDTARAKTALRLSATLASTDTAGASHYARQALAWSTRAGFGYGQSHAWLQLGALALIRHDPARAAACGQQAQAKAQPLPATPRVQRLRASIANNLGNVAEQRGQYQAAVTFYLQAATLLAGLPTAERTTLLTVYSNLGNCWQVLGQPDQALAYWQRALALAPGPVPALVPIYLHLAALHLQRARADSTQASRVRHYLRSARPLVAANPLYASSYYSTLGEYYVFMQRPTQARLVLAQALAAATRQGSAAQQAKVLFALGQVEWQLGQPAQARASLTRSLALTQQLGDPQQVIDDLQALGQLEEQAGRWQAALGYYQRGQHLRDSLANATVRQRVSLLETQYRTREQARQLRALRHEQQDQQRALRQQRRLSTVYLALALALAGLGALGFGLLRNRQRLARQQQALHDQHLRQLAQEKALQVAQAVLEGQEEERTRVARDLHDGLGGLLATVRLYLGTLRTRLDLPTEPAQLFTQSVSLLDNAIGELRQVARNLMPEAMLAFGLERALQDLCAAGQHTSAPRVQLQAYGLDHRLPHATEVALYRMVQELLTNVLRHAQASQVLVQLMRHPDALHLVVEDDGQGFDTSLARAGVGLRSVRARAAYLGGMLEVQSVPSQGTTVSFELKLDEKS
jgi:two-component system NarL family sensor kinase